EILVLLLAEKSDRVLADRFQVVGVRDAFRDVLDVFAGVAVLRPARLSGADAFRTRLHRARERLDLRAGIVVVKLAHYLVALRFDERRDRIAERRLPAVA